MSSRRKTAWVMSGLTLLTFFFIVTPAALAEEAPRYNFATTTATGTILAEPGQTVKVPAIYFFNIYGNRITHVSLYLTSAPKGWHVKIEPEMHEIQVNISGTIVTTSENLYVVPSKSEKDVPAVIPEGMTYITLGGVEGNVPVKIAYLNVTVPPDTPLGGTYSISVRAVGSWFGQAATLAFSQERSFTFKVQTITHSFTEEIIEPTTQEGMQVDPIYVVILLAMAAMGVGFYAGRKNK